MGSRFVYLVPARAGFRALSATATAAGMPTTFASHLCDFAAALCSATNFATISITSFGNQRDGNVTTWQFLQSFFYRSDGLLEKACNYCCGPSRNWQVRGPRFFPNSWLLFGMAPYVCHVGPTRILAQRCRSE